MSLPSTPPDVWTLATADDKTKALAIFSPLPSRQAYSAEFDEAVYMVALEGVTRYGLSEAVRKIVQGALGHGFFPNPVELRMQCDKAMSFHREMRERIERRQALERERIPERAPLTEAEKARQVERMARFYAQCDKSNTEAELEAIRAKYDPKKLAKIPNQPVDKNWSKVGGRAE